MTQQNLEFLAQRAALGDTTAADALIGQLEGILRQMDKVTLNRVVDAALYLKGYGAPDTAPLRTQLTSEELEWARQQFTEDEVIEELHELRTKGGVEFAEILRDIELKADGQ
jgi:hypothetical protein